VKRLVIVAAIAILLIGLVLLGLSDTWLISRPSEKDVKEAVLKDIAGEYGPSVFHSQWVTEVEVIEYGEPYLPNRLMLTAEGGSCIRWPVKVYFIDNQQKKVQRRVCVFYGGKFFGWMVEACTHR
jgi:hypothetical protein